MGVRSYLHVRFTVSIFFLLILLACGSMVSFAENGTNDSYSLSIQKFFADGTPDEAYNQTYKFHLEGYDKRHGTPVSKTVEIGPGNMKKDSNGKVTGEVNVGFEAPVVITVTELTDDMVLDGGDAGDWNLAAVSSECSMIACDRQTNLHINKNNGKIKIEKPVGKNAEDIVASTYRITCTKGDNAADTGKTWTLTLSAGESKVQENLPAGDYTLEELRAEEGFDTIIDDQDIVAGTDSSGDFYREVYVNDVGGSITIYGAGKPEDNETYYYKVRKNYDYNNARIVPVPSGGQITHGDNAEDRGGVGYRCGLLGGKIFARRILLLYK